MLFQRHDWVGNGEALRDAMVDLSWKVALELEVRFKTPEGNSVSEKQFWMTKRRTLYLRSQK